MEVSLIEFIFSKGYNTNGNSATTARGRASRTHQVIINMATANTSFALASTPNGLIKKKSNIGPFVVVLQMIKTKEASVVIIPVRQEIEKFLWVCEQILSQKF